MQFNLSRWVNKLTLAFFYRFLFCLYPHSYKFISLDTLKWRPRRNGKSLWEKWRKIWSFWWLRWSFLPLKNFLSSSQHCSVALLLQEQVQRIVFATILQEHKRCIFSVLCGKLYIICWCFYVYFYLVRSLMIFQRVYVHSPNILQAPAFNVDNN